MGAQLSYHSMRSLSGVGISDYLALSTLVVDIMHPTPQNQHHHALCSSVNTSCIFVLRQFQTFLVLQLQGSLVCVNSMHQPRRQHHHTSPTLFRAWIYLSLLLNFLLIAIVISLSTLAVVVLSMSQVCHISGQVFAVGHPKVNLFTVPGIIRFPLQACLCTIITSHHINRQSSS